VKSTDLPLEVFDFVAAQDLLPKVLTGYGLVPGVASTFIYAVG
jgi:hypothetical protein